LRILECAQGSPEWVDARLGVPTASQFHRILAPSSLKPSSQRGGYMDQLLAEWILGDPCDADASSFMDRGTALEDDAVLRYEIEQGVDVRRVGFCTADADPVVGCSPDFLVGDDGGGEIKCPSAKVHVGYLLGASSVKYRLQVQGALWITGRKWWDWYSYSPVMPPAQVRHERDEEAIAALAAALNTFCTHLEVAKQALRDKGCVSAIDRRRGLEAADKARQDDLAAELFPDDDHVAPAVQRPAIDPEDIPF